MSRLYRWPKKGVRVIYKIRHHRGHGVHSPFVYNLIRNVIEEKLPYYFYGDLEAYLDHFDGREWRLKKEYKLAFRLVNYFNAKRILEIGSGVGINTLCLASSSKQISCYAVEGNCMKFELASKLYADHEKNIVQLKNIKDIPQNEPFDCICINLNNYHPLTAYFMTELVNLCHDKSFIIVKGIRKSKKQNQLWKCLTANERRTAELDLFHMGILFFDKNLYRWKYQISF